MNDKTDPIINVLSVDAWRDGDSWTWNNWHKVGGVRLSLCDLKPRALLRELRRQGLLSSMSAGSVAVEDDQYNVVIVARGTREPLIALEYGAVQP